MLEKFQDENDIFLTIQRSTFNVVKNFPLFPFYFLGRLDRGMTKTNEENIMVFVRFLVSAVALFSAQTDT